MKKLYRIMYEAKETINQ